MLCNSTLFNSKPSPSVLSSPNSPSLKHFQIHLQLLPTLPRSPKICIKEFLSWSFKERVGMLLLQYFTLHRRANGAKSIITSSCWDTVTVALRISIKMSMWDWHISPLSDFEEYLLGLEFLGQKSPNLATTTSIVTVYFSQTMFVWHLLGQEVPDVLFAHLVKTTPIPATH